VIADAVAWHDVECGSYAADLPLWHELATAYAAPDASPVLDLGSGTGRVALELAAAGHDVTALDADAALLEELAHRARERELRVDAVAADARSFALERRYALIVAPMQVVQLLGGAAGRRDMLERVRDHLRPGAAFAAALADPFEAISTPEEALPPLPDVREHDGWVLSSQPLAVRVEADGVAIDRLRQSVSPGGDLTEELATIHLDWVSANELEREAAAAGLRPAGRREVPETPDHVGSTIVLLEASR
jgi:SAM-dependent methyltransferase